jgi:hypothetical protein
MRARSVLACAVAVAVARCLPGAVGEICDDTNNPCAIGLACVRARCQAASCSDGVRDGDETAVDCGGSCAEKCAAGQACGSATDCSAPPNGSAICLESACAFSCDGGSHKSGASCAADTNACCGDGCTDCTKQFANGTGECGSGSCVLASCDDGYVAVSGFCVSSQSTCCGTDCQNCTTIFPNGVGTCTSARCVFVGCKSGYHASNATCVADSCTDQIQNQDETGADCGGVCDAQGKTCAVGSGCRTPSDCATQYCTGNVCASCAAGTHVCSNTCLSNGSVASCGSNCTPCPTPSDPNAHATCDGTSCGSGCDSGYALHNGVCSGFLGTCCGVDCYDCTQDGPGWQCLNYVCQCKTRTCTL